MKETGEIELTFEEDIDHTVAVASLVIRGTTFTASAQHVVTPLISTVCPAPLL